MLREVGRVLGRGKGREMEVAIFAGNLGIGPGNVPATPREGVRVVRVLVRAGRGRANLGLVKVVKVLVRAGRGQANLGLVKVVMVKVSGTKVHVSTANKLDIKQPSALMHELLRSPRLGHKSRLVVLR